MPTPLKWLFNLFDALIAIGMAVMSILIFTNVVLRYGFSSGISASVEISRVILVWIIFLGAVVGLVKGVHLSVDAVLARLPQKARFICFLVAHGLMLWCCWLVAQGSWSLTVIEWSNITPLTGIPVGLTYAAALVASIIMALVLLIQLWRGLRGTLPSIWAGEKPDEASVSVGSAQIEEKIQ